MTEPKTEENDTCSEIEMLIRIYEKLEEIRVLLATPKKKTDWETVARELGRYAPMSSSGGSYFQRVVERNTREEA